MEKMEKKRKMPLPVKILIGMALGVICGIVLNLTIPQESIRYTLIVRAFDLGGNLFLNMFRMIVVPVVLISMICGVTAMNDPALLGRVGIKTLLIFAGTTVLGSVIAILISYGIGIGEGAAVLPAADVTVSLSGSVQSISETLSGIVPSNLFRSVVEANMLQVIFIAVIVGIALSAIQSRVPTLMNVIRELDKLNMRIVELTLAVAPYGVFCLLGNTFANFGFGVLLPLMKYVFGFLLGIMLFLLIVYPLMLWLARVSPLIFYRKFASVMLLAFSTSSSNAVLPSNIEAVTGRIGVNRKISTFILSLGATINMNGTAIMQGCAAIFIAQLYHVDLSSAQLVKIVLMSLIASVGTAGMPSAGVIMLGLVLESVGLPLSGIALVLGVDRIIDMFRTTLNITGDAVTAAVVAASEKQLDRDVLRQ